MGIANLFIFCVLVTPPCCATAAENSSCAASGSDEPDAQSALAISRTLSSGMSNLPSFAAFIAEYGRTYNKGSEEYEMRRSLYEHRVRQVHHHNSNQHRRWNAGVNHLTDQTDDELAQLRGYGAIKADADTAAADSSAPSLNQIDDTHLPEERDWTQLEATLADTNQQACGSCWAVATATVMRANAEISGYKRTFSPQELVSCVPNPHHCGGKGGCRGSTVELAMNWIMEQGLDTSEGTPYKARNSVCKKADAALLSHDGHHNGHHYGGDRLQDMIAVGFHGAKSETSAGLALGLQGWERLPENKYAPLMRAVAHTGPVGVSVAAREWHSYHNGILDSCHRDAVIDHAVTLVGYGKDEKSEDKYWIIKNSWSTKWGEQGNIRLLREEGDVHCGTDHQPKVGTGCDEGPASVPVCGMCGILYDSVVPHFKKA